ncbi:TetR family transcriptional regulator [Actinoplanes bogorensis]|uniref:TetR family transcriptional regulator n=1 Tax=Paractinoplanes bogorensis TaxID=1610840 RepID=A0ABS5YWK8_9ACTN|nr:TetR family transcriptional regulator [Actinoplanes bogorensis]MBU2667825.1 TetR family transcriptional regulator [Actinoplanes bogorensis]
MPRWESGSAERLTRIAMELFAEKGFEETSVVEIAKRARVTTRTFFRYFPDKREVLFAESDGLRAALVERIRQAPDDEPLAVVLGALAGFDWDTLGREAQRQRHAVIAANPELLERDLSKQNDIAVAFTDALQQRGVDAAVARLTSRVGLQVFGVAYERWLSAGDADLAGIVAETMALLSRTASARAG